MNKFISVPLSDGTEFVVNTDFIISIVSKDGLGALILNQIPFRSPCVDKLLPIDETQPILTKLLFEELKSLLGVSES